MWVRVGLSGARLVPEISDSATRTPWPKPQTAKTENLPGSELNGETYAKKKVCFSGARMLPEVGDSASRTLEPKPQIAKTENLPGTGLKGKAHYQHSIVGLFLPGHKKSFSVVVPAHR